MNNATPWCRNPNPATSGQVQCNSILISTALPAFRRISACHPEPGFPKLLHSGKGSATAKATAPCSWQMQQSPHGGQPINEYGGWVCVRALRNRR